MTTERKRKLTPLESYQQWFRSPNPFETGTLFGRQFPWHNLWEKYQYPPTPVRLEAPLPLGGRLNANQLLDLVKKGQRQETAKQIIGKKTTPTPKASTDIENQIFDSAGWTRYFQSNPDALGQMAASLNLASADISSVVQGMRSQFEAQKFQAAITRMQTEDTTKRISEQQATSDWIKQNYLAAAQGGALVESEGKRTERERAFNQVAFEDWRGRLLEQLTGPANEVERWFVQNKPNPYLRYYADEAQEGRDALVVAREKARQQGEELPTQAFQGQVLPLGPPTPDWLTSFAPSARSGKPLTKLGTVPTPSGQQLTNMSPSQAAWLSGAIGYFGGRPWGDILAEAQLMQPHNLGGGARWRPVSQF